MSACTTLKLTTDHCFVQGRQAATLRLLDNAALQMRTDHRYTLSLTLGGGGPCPVPAETIKRFQISQLSKLHMREGLVSLISQHAQVFDCSQDVDAMDAQLVAFCQQV
jgi:hypothetical protein